MPPALSPHRRAFDTIPLSSNHNAESVTREMLAETRVDAIRRNVTRGARLGLIPDRALSWHLSVLAGPPMTITSPATAEELRVPNTTRIAIPVQGDAAGAVFPTRRFAAEKIELAASHCFGIVNNLYAASVQAGQLTAAMRRPAAHPGRARGMTSGRTR